MYPEIFYSNTFTLLAEAEVGKHFYWNIAGFLVHGQVLIVIWFVLLILLVFSILGTANADRIPGGGPCREGLGACRRHTGSAHEHRHSSGRRP